MDGSAGGHYSAYLKVSELWLIDGLIVLTAVRDPDLGTVVRLDL